MMNAKQLGAAVVVALASTAASAEITASGAVSNNYIWRGLTQTMNETAVSGSIDWAGESGLYAGTWVSNVKYGDSDNFSYEHDIYFGFSGGDAVSYDVGFLYYNYDDDAKFDFYEVYGSIGVGGFSATAYVLAGAETDEAPGQDFGFGSTTYISLDYGVELANGLALGVHVGQHAGDFAEAFNGTVDDYIDYNVTMGVGDFTLMASLTDLDDNGQFATNPELGNDDLKFVVSYGASFGLE